MRLFGEILYMFLAVCCGWLIILMVFRHRIDGSVSAKFGALLLLAVTVGGCGVRPGDHPISSNCEWTEAGNGSLNLEKAADRGHLRYDALTAEDMAIRCWADKYAGPKSGQFGGSRSTDVE
ncbi:MAG TPA: hypothetical protein VF899_15240 [Pyrinomonadaceae bacterium]